MSIDRAALAAGTMRFASGVSFLVDPARANRLWGDPDEPDTTARVLLRSMGYRDTLIGGLLAAAALRGRNTRGRFLASGGTDAADVEVSTKPYELVFDGITAGPRKDKPA